MRSISATEVPPNFCTIKLISSPSFLGPIRAYFPAHPSQFAEQLFHHAQLHGDYVPEPGAIPDLFILTLKACLPLSEASFREADVCLRPGSRSMIFYRAAFLVRSRERSSAFIRLTTLCPYAIRLILRLSSSIISNRMVRCSAGRLSDIFSAHSIAITA